MWTTGKVIERIDWNDKLFSLRIAADVEPFIAGQFIKLSEVRDDKRVARAYSVVNPPGKDYVEVLAVTVDDGQLSPALHQLNKGDEIQVSKKAAGFMVLEELPKEHTAKHLWFLATGTAVGPFLSIMETDEPWERYEKVVLVYGVREEVDLAYLEQIEAFKEKYPDQFQLIVSVTRESVNGTISERIPDAIINGGLEKHAGFKLTEKDSQVVICGNPGMITGAQQALYDKGLIKNLRRAPGNITVEKYW
ncbi:ferredoxin--NADP reductase [Shewanella sp. 202IG2-18]|uniref:ferredoxin--NADP reductase n=1 Tax=Parashewanella hymeniacidonis TaxID=2807618 RepID=UPI0019605CEE|nr:ferredoxin--NADP reductase [Parashewanella hymeniacidonis]MBM7072837.1 ferredoxin--NADP reductase [Parashewanella hymeniacidonis]